MCIDIPSLLVVPVGRLSVYKILTVFILIKYGCCREWEGLARKPVNYASLFVIATPTERHKSVHNCCVIVILAVFLCCPLCFL